MLLHVSIPADEPERVARAIADVSRGTVLLFPPVPGAFMVWLGPQQSTIIEVNPRGHEHVPANRQFGIRTNPAPSPYSEAHVAIGTPLAPEGVFAVGRREGWLAQHSDRGGMFSVIELWLENKFLLEVVTEAEQRRYSASVTIEGFRTVFGLDLSGGNAA